MTKSWVFDLVDYPGADEGAGFEPQVAVAALDRHFDKWARVESLGFEGVFLSEHHFGRVGLAPSPNLLVAALIQRTKRLRVGVLAQVLPMYPPYRVPEECAMLDLMSHGRLEIGVARGLGFLDTDRIGMPREEVRGRFEEALDILVKGLTEDEFSYEGEFYRYPRLSISPRPLQQPRPPIWQTVRTPDSARASARRRFKVCGAYEPAEEIAEVFDAYRETNPSATADDMGIRRHVYVGRTHEEAKALCFNTLAVEAKKYRGPAAHLGEALMTGVDAIWGTPAEVAEEIERQMEVTGAGHILMMFTPGHSFEQMERSMVLYGEEVIPRLQKVSVAAQ